MAIRLSEGELSELIDVQILGRTDWPARFSCNRREVWATPSLGYSRLEDREDLTGRFHLLDRAHELVLEERAIGGRIFICEHGIYTYVEEIGEKVQIAEFDLTPVPGFLRHCNGHG